MIAINADLIRFPFLFQRFALLDFFAEDHACELVPVSWTKNRQTSVGDDGKKVTYVKCLWPPHKDRHRVLTMVRKEVEPNPKTWQPTDAIVLEFFGKLLSYSMSQFSILADNIGVGLWLS